MSKILFASDTHLHPTIWDDLPEVWGDAYRAFDQICLRAAEDGEISSVFLGGDIFDRHPESCAVACFLRNMDRLKAAGKPVYAIQGQHGRVRARGRDDAVPWPSVHSWVTALGREPVAVFPKVFAIGIDHCGSDELVKHFSKIRKSVSIVFLHQIIKGGVPLIRNVQNWEFEPGQVPEHVKLVLAGDLHAAVEFPIPGGKLVYNGSTVLRSIDEPAEKFYTLVDERLNVERIPLKGRVFKKAVIFTGKALEQSLEAVAKMEPDSVLYVKYDPRLEGVEAKLREAGEGIHFKFMSSPVLDEVVGGGEPELPENTSAEGLLDEFVDRERRADLHSFLLSLLTAQDKRAELERQRTERMEAK